MFDEIALVLERIHFVSSGSYNVIYAVLLLILVNLNIPALQSHTSISTAPLHQQQAKSDRSTMTTHGTTEKECPIHRSRVVGKVAS